MDMYQTYHCQPTMPAVPQQHDVIGRVLLTALFTGAQLGAVAILAVGVDIVIVRRAALAAVVAGAAVAVIDSWQAVRALLRRRAARMPPYPGNRSGWPWP